MSTKNNNDQIHPNLTIISEQNYEIEKCGQSRWMYVC